jgi:hypothetical protein
VIRRLGQIYDLLQSYPGKDCFSLYVENGGQGRLQIDFPNDTTGHCLELEQQLRTLVGAGTVSVVPAANSATVKPPGTPAEPWSPPNTFGSPGGT